MSEASGMVEFVGWVELLRNPSRVAIVTMGFASLNPSYELQHRLRSTEHEAVGRIGAA